MKATNDNMEKIKLHLGCGTRYLNGYINIDHPLDKHTVQSHLIADRYEDIQLLKYSASSVSEIRLHHVFEHFPRQIALAILCRWVDWLKPGGTLHIETPDVMRSAWALISPLTSRSARSQIVRHLFGSHEASWAMHWMVGMQSVLKQPFTHLISKKSGFNALVGGLCEISRSWRLAVQNDFLPKNMRLLYVTF